MPPKKTNKKLAKEHGLEESDVIEVREAFDLIASGSPSISIHSVQRAMSALGLELSTTESKQVTKHLTQLTDSDEVTFDMFLEIVSLKMSTRDRGSEVDRAFALFDPNATGRITVHDLRRVAKLLNEDIKEQDLLDMLEQAGATSSDGIGKSQFEEVMARAGIW